MAAARNHSHGRIDNYIVISLLHLFSPPWLDSIIAQYDFLHLRPSTFNQCFYPGERQWWVVTGNCSLEKAEGSEEVGVYGGELEMLVTLSSGLALASSGFS